MLKIVQNPTIDKPYNPIHEPIDTKVDLKVYNKIFQYLLSNKDYQLYLKAMKYYIPKHFINAEDLLMRFNNHLENVN